MRQMITGLVAAVAVMTAGAAPAMACGFSSCSPCGYVSPCAQTYVPTVVGTGCATGCGGWTYGRFAEPTTQYYYVNQGPTYSGPGMFAPYPTYEENALPEYGYEYGYAPRHYGYGHAWRHHGYGYAPRHYGYGPRYGYMPRMHYGYGARHYGYPLRRYY